MRLSKAEASRLGLPKATTPPLLAGKGLLATPDYASKLEAEYATFLEGLKQGRLIWSWWYEALTFRLAPGCSYRPDFLVQMCDGFLEVHECKGFFREDAKVKWKVVAEKYPCFTFVLIQRIKGQWIEERL